MLRQPAGLVKRSRRADFACSARAAPLYDQGGFDNATGGAAVPARTVRDGLLAGILIASSVSPGTAQSADDLASLRKDIDALKEGQAAVLRELQQIKSLLTASPPAARGGAPSEVVLTVGDAPSKGKKEAKLILVEFTDYQ
jgi:hypothetical protein